MNRNERLKDVFESAYQALNAEQKKAVDAIEGPVLVIAGPGTGKTQILAIRIGKILLETDVLPENILCLTYTDAGSVAMRKRLLQFIGPDAYKVNIYTFHAFCNDVIQDNLSLFEKTALDPISELEKVELFKQLIDAFPKNHPLKRYRGDVYYEIQNLSGLFSTMKREGWTPEFILSAIQQYLEDLPNRSEYVYQKRYKEFKAGDLRIHKFEEENERMQKLQAAVNEFENYQQLMRKRNRYDFEDMINWVIKAFEENKNLLADYQERYQYILADEYQDTSGTQNRIIELLISYWEKPNVFVVGDDDQSIFRFQGANIENMLRFAGNYKDDLTTVVLTNNYRSTQPILNVSKSLIDRNKERLVEKLPNLSKTLVSANDKVKHIPDHPRIKEYETQRQEMADIIFQIEKIIASGTSPGKIAVIYKENKYGEELTEYFRLKNIPYFTKKDLNILELPFIQKIILMLQYFAAEHDVPYGGDEMLFEILHAEWFQVPAIEIAKLSVESANTRFSKEPLSLRRMLFEKTNIPAKDLFSEAESPALKAAGRIIEEIIHDVPNVTVQQLFEKCIRKTGILSYVMQSPEKHFLLQLITVLFDFIKEETRRNPFMQLKEMMNMITIMQQEEIRLPFVQVSGNERGINLLTAHGSKGLEFEHVFFAGCVSGYWEKKRKPTGGYKLPDTIFSTSTEQNTEEELRRIFYVALTRAEKYLHISYFKYKQDGKETEPSVFIAELQDAHGLPAEKVFISDDVMNEFTVLQFTETASPEIEKIENEFVERLLAKFSMNVTALNNYLHCPLEFYFNNLIRIPSGRSEATEFGSAVHHALERLFKKMQEDEKNKFPAKEEFIKDFEWYMHRNREHFTKEQFERRMEYGREILVNYYETYINTFNKIVALERNIQVSLPDGIPLKGKLDKLEFDGKQVNIVDYKTGDPEKGITKIKGPSEKDPKGGDYWRQAVFYKILLDNYTIKEWKAVSSEFDFIEPDKKKKYKREKLFIQPEDITSVTQQIKTVWGKIQAHDFYTGCGKPECHWCNFVKTNNMAVALHEVKEEVEE
ncbi:MAG: ATP-dependent helicase [Chitinophagales bacterium]